MEEPRLDRHGSRIARELFEENTGQIGSLGDIVEEHNNGLILVHERSAGGADSGVADFEAEMLASDPESDDESGDDLFLGDPQDVGEADLTGTAEGIARGFGTHLSQDLGPAGFEIKDLPEQAIKARPPVDANGELSDYDD